MNILKAIKKSKAYGAFEYALIIALVIVLSIIIFTGIKNKSKAFTWINSSLDKANQIVGVVISGGNPEEPVVNESLKVHFIDEFICDDGGGNQFPINSASLCMSYGGTIVSRGVVKEGASLIESPQFMVDNVFSLMKSQPEAENMLSVINEGSVEEEIIIKENLLSIMNSKSFYQFIEKAIFVDSSNRYYSGLTELTSAQNEENEDLVFMPKEFDTNYIDEYPEVHELTDFYTYEYSKPIKSIYIEEDNYYENTIYIRFKEVGRDNIYSKEYSLVVNTDFKISPDGCLCSTIHEITMPNGVLINDFKKVLGDSSGDYFPAVRTFFLGNNKNVYRLENESSTDVNLVSFPEKIIKMTDNGSYAEYASNTFLSETGKVYISDYSESFTFNTLDTSSYGFIKNIYQGDLLFLLNSNGEVFVRGDDMDGNSGTGNVNMNINTFQKINFPAGVKIKDLSTSGYHTLFLTEGKEVYSTGKGSAIGVKEVDILPDNKYIGTYGSYGLKIPQKIQSLSNVSSVKTLHLRSFYLTETNELYASGLNGNQGGNFDNSNLGINSTDITVIEPIKTNFSGVSIKEIYYASDDSTVILTSSGKIFVAGSFLNSDVFVPLASEKEFNEVIPDYDIIGVTKNNKIYKYSSDWEGLSEKEISISICETFETMQIFEGSEKNVLLLIKTYANKYYMANVVTKKSEGP